MASVSHQNIHPSVQSSLDNFVEFIRLQQSLRTTDVSTMAQVLDTLGNQRKYQVNVHWQDIGWHTLSGARTEVEDPIGYILSLNFGAHYLVKPTELQAYFFKKDPVWSFFRMSYDGLPPSGVYTDEDNDEDNTYSRCEEYVREGRLLLPRSCWDENQMPNGQPLSPNAELIVRELQGGTFMIVSKGNPLNRGDMDKYRNNIALHGDDSDVLKKLRQEFG